MLAIVVAALIWVFGEALGTILTGGGRPNSGPLLALLALTYWPLAATAAIPPAAPATATADEGRAADDPRLDSGIFAALMLVVAAVSAARRSRPGRGSAAQSSPTPTSPTC